MSAKVRLLSDVAKLNSVVDLYSNVQNLFFSFIVAVQPLFYKQMLCVVIHFSTCVFNTCLIKIKENLIPSVSLKKILQIYFCVVIIMLWKADIEISHSFLFFFPKSILNNAVS